MTPLQLALARRIATAFTNDAGGHPTNAIGTRVWISEVVSTAADKGTLTSMVNAGLALVWAAESRHDAATCRLTDAGWDALQAANAAPVDPYVAKLNECIAAGLAAHKAGDDAILAFRAAMRARKFPVFRLHLDAMRAALDA